MDEICIDCGFEYPSRHLKNGLCYSCSYSKNEEDNFINIPLEDAKLYCDCEIEKCKRIPDICKNLAYR